MSIKAIIVESFNCYGTFDGYVAVSVAKGVSFMPRDVSFRTKSGARNWMQRNWPSVEVTA